MSDWDNFENDDFIDDRSNEEIINQWLDDHGLLSIADRAINGREDLNDLSNERHTVYGELYDLLEHLYDIGVLDFASWWEDDDGYHYAVDDDSGKVA